MNAANQNASAGRIVDNGIISEIVRTSETALSVQVDEASSLPFETRE